MKNGREHILTFALLLCAGTLLVGCAADRPEKSEAPDPTPSPAIEEFDSFEAYTQALAALVREYGLGDEEALSQGVEVDYSNPYLSKRILITTEDDLPAYPSAARVLHYEKDYVLQFRTEEETRAAYEALKRTLPTDAVALDGIVFTQDGQG